jgi:5-bromo-4-chloroindolyl phosphate hydrolysis protein
MSEKNEKFAPLDAVSHIADIVNESISTGNYSALNREITKALNEAADAVHDSIFGKKYYQVDGAKTYRSSTKNSYQNAKDRKGAAGTGLYGQAASERRGSSARAGAAASGVASPFGAHVRAILGTAATIFCGIIFTGGMLVDGGLGPMLIFFGILTAFSGWNMVKGFKKVGRIRRAKQILTMMENRDTITIEEIASAFGKSEKWVADDIQEMIRDGIFAGKTYMDKEETAFMTSHAAYNQYLETMRSYEARRQDQGRQSAFAPEDLKEYARMEKNAAKREADSAKAAAQLDKETAEMVEEGKAFIAHIHQKNEEVPGEPFTSKLNRLEEIVTNIFDRVAADPKSAPDLHRLMKYYLPTTQKLVDTYATLDRQPVQGENIENAKREIEASLDTINEAFERFLNQFFQSTAWDVSSDISVMNQMMQQDGLTGGNDFARAAAAAQAASHARNVQVQTMGGAQALVAEEEQ